MRRVEFHRPFLAIVLVGIAYGSAAASEDWSRKQRAFNIWNEYMTRGVSAFYDNGKEREAINGDPSIFVRISATGPFILNGSWIIEGALVSVATTPAARLELYEEKISKCHPGLMECSAAEPVYDFWLLRRMPGQRPEVLQKWRNLQKNVVGYDPAHGMYVPDVKGSITYEQNTHDLHVSIDNIQEPLSETLHLNW